MKGSTFLGFDYGRKSIGAAVGSTHSGLAEPVTIIAAHGDKADWDRISHVISEWKPDALVVGLPLNMDGSENPMTHAARAFGNQLKDRYNLPVHMVDERLSSRIATDNLLAAGVPLKRHKDRIDKVAAQAILQAFLIELGEQKPTQRENP